MTESREKNSGPTPCPACAGYGHQGYVRERPKPCHSCGGTGLVRPEKSG